jgi:hypothetical protein
MSEKSLRRLPLRQLLASSDRVARELAELVQTQLLQRIADFRDLSRPVRRKTPFPTMLAFQNGMRRVLDANEQMAAMLAMVQDHLDAIRDHAHREKLSRSV